MNKFLQLSSLEKVMPDFFPCAEEYTCASLLRGEEFSWQIAYQSDEKALLSIEIESGLKDFITLYDVEYIPSGMPAYPPDRRDEHYLSFEPGLYPDLLIPLERNEIAARPVCRSLWVCVKTTAETPAGNHRVTLTFTRENGEAAAAKTMDLQIINAALPPQKLIFTQWFHTDCIASYYGVEVFSERHWTLIEAFVKMAATHGMNMILTPIFTLPLDTQVGGERPTAQLVDIEKKGDAYSFGFVKLKRWIDLCLKQGIEYFEMAHLFTQWGAYFTPKIVATEDGVEKRVFGWDVGAASDEYKNFLDQFLPALTRFLKDEGAAEKTYFHISDEPHGPEKLAQYLKVKDMVKDHLRGFKVIDALSDFSFYETGAVENPITANDAIEPFLKANIKNLWTYYCCAQNKKVSNRFFSMPSYRNRIIGIQMYKYGIAGFLHWAYNFYYSQFSRRLINPFVSTDADGGFPSGDAFSVYPGANGPLPSLRLKVFHEALQDMRALALLERYMPKSEIVSMLEELAGMEITFSEYPHNADFILKVREMIRLKLVGFIGGS
jgi:hypothetical protein